MISSDDEQFMRLAVDACRRGIEMGQTPFGAALIRDGEAVVATHNHVWLTGDITAHAEMHCLRLACEKLAAVDLSGCTLYSTTEPCPMCFAAIHWARCDRIVFGTGIEAAAEAGFNELPISNAEMKRLGGSPVAVDGGCLADECAALFDEWRSRPDRRKY